MEHKELTQKLLQWYDENGRDLPWRYKNGVCPDPYIILVSEFMLQQTTVKTVIPYFERFMKRFPTIKDLARAREEDVYQEWQGLGYYTRAKSLHQTAQIIVNDFNGEYPTTKEKVLRLKGIGKYTAASFLSLAFNQNETVVDGNVKRIICRLYHLTTSIEENETEIIEKASLLTSDIRPADYASAIMDLGATVCTPKNPQCLLCPWSKWCLSKNCPELEQIPNRIKISKKNQKGSVYLIFNKKREILIRKRIEKGLLLGLYEFPWVESGKLFEKAKPTNQSVNHIFTHINLTLDVYILNSETSPISDGFFVKKDELKNYPLSTLMKKVLKTLSK